MADASYCFIVANKVIKVPYNSLQSYKGKHNVMSFRGSCCPGRLPKTKSAELEHIFKEDHIEHMLKISFY